MTPSRSRPTCRMFFLSLGVGISLNTLNVAATYAAVAKMSRIQNISGDTNEYLKVEAARETLSHAFDSADLLQKSLGYSAFSTGGVASLPVLNGMADDRVATIIDGMRITSSCPNHMNPAFSYIDPDSVASADVIAGLTPVSIGGDSTGGTIQLKRRDPLFSSSSRPLVTGRVQGDYRSLGGGSGASGSVTIANAHVSLKYTGSYRHASDYRTGGAGKRVPSTSYLSFNHAFTAGWRKDNHLLALTVGQQDIPYEAFPNQYMDMTNNRSTFVNGSYQGNYAWGVLNIRGFWQRVEHAMNMLADKGGHTATTGMPMNTNGRMAGYTWDLTIPLNGKHALKLGNNFEHNGLNEWWPALPGAMMMGPSTFHNITDGRRDRLGQFVEWNASWTSDFSTQLGFRNDVVMMNTGDVSPYSWTARMQRDDIEAAKRFNAKNHARSDVNFDVTATAKWRPTSGLMLEGGYARKTRSPNMYERYAWAPGNMAVRMINWFGDGNGYLGHVNLKPEVANTMSVTFKLSDADQRLELTLQPFYTYTEDYINVIAVGRLPNGRSKLEFRNHNAQSYGLNGNSYLRLWRSPSLGNAKITANLNWVRGQDFTTHSGLYQQMPLNGVIGFKEDFDKFRGRIDVTLVKSKATVDRIREEVKTPGYALLGLGASYRWRKFLLDASIDNVFNQHYYLPIGGISIIDLKNSGTHRALEGYGRSFNLAASVVF